jgi:hypothetical protein
MIDDAKIQELKAKYKDLIAVQASDGTTLVFRKPKRLEFDQWWDNREKGSQTGLSLAQQCLVHPTQQEMMATLEETPGLLMCRNGVVDSITDLAGADGGATSKKL